MKYPVIAIVGATGLVGKTFLQVMDEMQVEVDHLRLFASPRSIGTPIEYQGKTYLVEELKPGCFTGVDYALFSAGSERSLTYAPQAVAEGAIVIDNSNAWRMDPTVPLVVPEINMEEAYQVSLIANPNCSTIQSVLPLYALDQAYHLVQVEYNTYQSVSGSGQKGLDDLIRSKQGEEPQFYPYNISQTAIPHIDTFQPDGFTKEEHKMMDETRKILSRPDLAVSATCVRIPVERGHGVSIRATFQRSFDVSEVRTLLANQSGIRLVDDPDKLQYPTTTMAMDTNDVYVGRLRQDPIHPNTLLLYVTADNIRKGAATNAVQILKELMNHAKSR